MEKYSQKKSLKNHAVMKESFGLPLVPQAMEQHLMRPVGNIFDKSSLSSKFLMRQSISLFIQGDEIFSDIFVLTFDTLPF